VKYLVLMYGDERVWQEADADQQETWLECHRTFTAAVRERAVILGGEALGSAEDTTTLDPLAAGDRRPVTDGPYAETVEQLGGFYLVEAADLDLMIDLCHELPDYYRLELRPVVEYEL
jgi:hypothetical protein